MMPSGRPPKKSELVGSFEGSDNAKLRLKMILETLSGERTIQSACEELSIGEAAFHKLRKRFLKESLEGLEERQRGVKPKHAPLAAEEIDKLQIKIGKLQEELAISRIREEIALATQFGVSSNPKKGP